MLSSLILAVGFLSIAQSAPLNNGGGSGGYSPFPLPDGFPNPNSQQLAQIQKIAGGSLPNSPLPSYLTDDASVAWSLISLNEAFEVAYFTSLYNNITNGVSGYELNNGENRTQVLQNINAIANQEKLHYLGASAILKTAGKPTITPCSTYKFPVTNYKAAIALANTFTDVVVGTLAQAAVTNAEGGGEQVALVNVIGSVIGQESEQIGWFRTVQGKMASAAPFLTTEAPQFAFSALKMFLVESSCPDLYRISDHVASFPPLTVVSGAKAANSTVTYSVASSSGSVKAGSNSIVYISGLNLPVTVDITNVQTSNGVTTFQAPLPFASVPYQFAQGLSIAALVKGSGHQFANSSEVASATIAGPGLLELM